MPKLCYWVKWVLITLSMAITTVIYRNRPTSFIAAQGIISHYGDHEKAQNAICIISVIQILI